MRIIGGEFSGRNLVSPKDQTIRPTTDRLRETIFNILAHKKEDFFKDRDILDLFAGTGALGLEALSRGGRYVTFVEKNFHAKSIIQQNIINLCVKDRSKIIFSDIKSLKDYKIDKQFDLIFADPPYREGLGEKALSSIVKMELVKEGAYLILEEDRTIETVHIEGLTVIDRKEYGKTVFSIYTKALL